MKQVLFACVYNAGRSQMAAALWNRFGNPQKTHAISAGTQPAAHVHLEVVTALNEIGIDVSTAKPQRLTPELLRETSLLVTMGCGEVCPEAPGLRDLAKLDWPLADPKGQSLDAVRAIRDDIADRVRALLRAEGLLASE